MNLNMDPIPKQDAIKCIDNSIFINKLGINELY